MLYYKVQMGGSGTLEKRKTQESKMKSKVSRIAHEDSKTKLKIWRWYVGKARIKNNI